MSKQICPPDIDSDRTTPLKMQIHKKIINLQCFFLQQVILFLGRCGCGCQPLVLVSNNTKAQGVSCSVLPPCCDKLPHHKLIAYLLKRIGHFCREFMWACQILKGHLQKIKPKLLTIPKKASMDQLSSTSSVACCGGDYSRPGNFQWL